MDSAISVHLAIEGDGRLDESADYYDRENYQIYREGGEGQPIERIDEGRHALASLGRVPLFQMRVTRDCG